MTLPRLYKSASGRDVLLFDHREAREPFTLYPPGPSSTTDPATGATSTHPGGLKKAGHMTRSFDASGQGAHAGDPAYQAAWDVWENIIPVDVATLGPALNTWLTAHNLLPTDDPEISSTIAEIEAQPVAPLPTAGEGEFGAVGGYGGVGVIFPMGPDTGLGGGPVPAGYGGSGGIIGGLHTGGYGGGAVPGGEPIVRPTEKARILELVDAVRSTEARNLELIDAVRSAIAAE